MRRRTLLALALAAAAGACTMERPSEDDNPDLRYESAKVAAPDAQATTEVSSQQGAEEPPYETGVPTPPVPVRDDAAGLTATGRFIPVNNYPINASLTVSNAGTAGTLVSKDDGLLALRCRSRLIVGYDGRAPGPVFVEPINPAAKRHTGCPDWYGHGRGPRMSPIGGLAEGEFGPARAAQFTESISQSA